MTSEILTALLTLLTVATITFWFKVYKEIVTPRKNSRPLDKSRVMRATSRQELVNKQKPVLTKNIEINSQSALPEISSHKKKDDSHHLTKEKFRWCDLPYLKFECLDAPDMSSYSQFASIKDFGNVEVKEESVQERFLPNIKKDLVEISIDSKIFCWGKLFAKPDAVFYDKDKDEYVLVEYKSRDFYALGSLTPLAVFQTLISAEVLKKHIIARTDKENRKPVKVRSFMRLNNKVVEIKGWEAMIQHVLAMLPEVLQARDKDSISASDLSKSFVLFDSVFKFKPQNQEDACYLGQMKHIRIAKKSKKLVNTDNKITGDNHQVSSNQCPC